MEQFSFSLNVLQKNYRSLHEHAADILGRENLHNGCSVVELDKSISQQKLKIEQQLREAEHVLVKFLSAKSLYTPHMEELQPFREEVRDLLVHMHNNTVSPEQVQDAIIPYKLFLDAMAIDDSEEKEVLFYKIDKLFPPCVSRALYGGKYYIDKAVPLIFEGDHACSSHSIVLTFEEETSSATAETVEGILPCSAVHSFNPTDEECTTPAKNSSFDKTLDPFEQKNSDDAEIHPDEKQCGITLNIRPNLVGIKLKKFINSIFKNEYITLFQLFVSFGILTQDQVQEFGTLRGKFDNTNWSKVFSALQFLITKGCIKKINGTIPVLTMLGSSVAVVQAVAKERKMDSFALFQSKKCCAD